MARLDNLFGSGLNLKLGKFELDNLVSEKRILTLTNISGVYQTYHFIPVGDTNVFGQIITYRVDGTLLQRPFPDFGGSAQFQ